MHIQKASPVKRKGLQNEFTLGNPPSCLAADLHGLRRGGNKADTLEPARSRHAPSERSWTTTMAQLSKENIWDGTRMCQRMRHFIDDDLSIDNPYAGKSDAQIRKIAHDFCDNKHLPHAKDLFYKVREAQSIIRIPGSTSF